MISPYQMEELEDTDLFCTEQQLKDRMKQVAEEISSIIINSPITVNFFINCHALYVNSAVTIEKLYYYVHLYKNQLLTDTTLFEDILVLFQLRLKFMDEISQVESQTMKNIFQYFSWIISQFMCPSSQLLNKYISFQLAVHNLVKCPLHNNFPNYLISFEEINFGIFCRCLIQFFNNPFGYDFESNKNGLAKMIENQFEKAIYSSYSQSGPEIFQLRNFFSILIPIYRQNDENPFKIHVFNELMGKNSFSCIMFSLLRKIGRLNPFFKQMIEIKIWLGKNYEAMDIIEFALSFYTSLSLQLDIQSIIDDYQEWASQWIQVLMNHKFLMISSIFLNGLPHYFVILNKLLLLYKFKDQFDFRWKLDQLGYQGASRTLPHNNQTRQSMKHMLSQQIEDAEQLYHLLLKDGEE